MKDVVNNTLLTISGSSYVAWEFLKSFSEICSVLLPIVGVLSAILIIILNGGRIIKNFCKKHEKDE